MKNHAPGASRSAFKAPILKVVPAFLAALLLAAVSAPAQIKVRSLDQATLQGSLVSLTETSLVLKVGAEEKTFPLKRVVSLGFDERTIAEPGPKSDLIRVDIAGGDRLFGEIVDSDDDGIRVSTRCVGTVRISYDNLARVVILRNCRGRDAQVQGDPEAERDLLYLESRDTIDRVVGDLGSFKKDAVMFQWNELGESRFDFKKEKVLAVALSDVEVPKAPEGVHAVAWFQDGSRLTGAVTMKIGGPMSLRFAEQDPLTLRVEELNQLSFKGGDFLHLSDLEPKSIQETPYFEGGLTYGLKRDRGLDGGRVVIGRRFFPKALAVHSRCVLEYSVPKGYSSFVTAVGIDDAVSRRSVKGEVAFKVKLDEKSVGKTTKSRAGQAPIWLDGIAVKAGQTLRLEADFADRAHFNGWAVWGGPMFIKAP